MKSKYPISQGRLSSSQRARRRNAARYYSLTKFLAFSLGLSVAGLSPDSARGADATWTGATNQDWNTTSNYNITPNGNNIIVNTSTGNYPIISANQTITPVDISVGNGAGGTGRLDQTAGTAGTGNGNWLFVGANAGTGTFNLSGGTFNVGGSALARLYIGGREFGATTTGTGTVNVTGGTLNANLIETGYGTGNGTLNVNTAGTVSSTGEIWFGEAAAANRATTGTGTIGAGGIMNSGTWTVIGRSGSAGSSGTLTLDGGILNVKTGGANGNLEIAVFDAVSGTLNVNANSDVNLRSNASILLGAQNTSGNGTVNQGGGNVTFYSDAGATVGGTGALTLSAGSSSGVYTYNLNGGTLTVPRVNKTTSGAGQGIFNFNGGTIRPTASTLTFMQGLTLANVRNGGAIIDTNGFDVTIAQPLVHSNVTNDNAIDGGLTKNGAGTLTLVGNNTSNPYTGMTSINSGRLNFAGGQTSGLLGDVVVANGATLGLQQFSGGPTLSSNGGLTFGTSGATNLVFDFNNLANPTSPMAVFGGALTKNGTINVSLVSLGGLTTATDIPLLNYFGGESGAGSFNLTNATSGHTSFALNDTATGLFLNVSALINKWTGAVNNVWDINATLNWNAPDQKYLDGDNVLFDDNTTQFNVSIAAPVAPANVTFSNAATYTISGATIGGTGGLTLNGSGTVVLLNANTYTGVTNLGSGTTLQLGDGTSGNDGSITGTSGVTNNGTLVYNRFGANNTAAYVISGSGGVVKNGVGTQILGGVNTYTGGTTINAGTLQITTTAGAANNGMFNLGGGEFQVNVAANNFGYGPTINVTADSVFSSIGAGQINYTGTLTGSGNALDVRSGASRLYMNGTVSGITQFNVTSGAMGFDLNVGNRGGGVPVNVSSGASLYFFANATPTMANNITLNGGTGQAGVGALFQEGGGTPVITGTVTLAGDSSIGGNTAGANVNISGQITGPGALTKIGVNTYTLSNAANNYAGTTTISAGVLQIGAGGTTGTLPVGSAIVDNGTLAFNRINAVTQGVDFSAAAITGTGGVTVSGVGNVTTLNATNTFTGTTTVNDSATLVLSGANTLSTGNVALNNGSTIRLEAYPTNTVGVSSSALGSNPAAGQSGFILGNNTNGVIGIQLRSDSSVEFANTTTGNNSGNVTLNFNVDNLGAAAATGPQGNVLTFAPASETARNFGNGLTTFNTIINVNGQNGYSLAIGKIVGVGNQTTINSVTANTTIGSIDTTVSSVFNFGGTGTTTVTGPIANTGATTLTVNRPAGGGNGTTIFLGANTYSGVTTVGSGTLQVGSGTQATGTLGSGNVSVLNTAVTLTLFTGTAISDTATLTLEGGGTPGTADNGYLTLMGVNETVGALNFGTASQPPGLYGSSQSTSVGSPGFTINDEYFKGTGTLTVVPEPSTWTAMMMGAVGMFLGLRRSRRRL